MIAGIEALVPVRLLDARHQLLLRVRPRTVADEMLLLGELVLEQERILPLECR